MSKLLNLLKIKFLDVQNSINLNIGSFINGLGDITIKRADTTKLNVADTLTTSTNDISMAGNDILDVTNVEYKNGAYGITNYQDLNTNTGLLSGGSLTINTDTTKLDIASGSGRICDYSNPLAPIHKIITWDNIIGVNPELSTYWDKWVGIQESKTPNIGEPIFSVGFTQLQKRSVIVIGRLWGTTVDSKIVETQNYVTNAFDQGNFGQDISYALGSFNKFGNVYQPNGANLKLNKTSGESFRFGANYTLQPLSPHVIIDSAQVNISAYYYIDQNSTSANILTDIDPNNWDDGTSKTLVPVGYYTVQRLYYFPVSQILMVAYGQRLFSTMTAAISVAGEDDININSLLIEGAILRGWLAIKQGTTSLNSNVLFKEAHNLNEPQPRGSVGTQYSLKSYGISDPGNSDQTYLAGFYNSPLLSTTLSTSGTNSLTYGTSNTPIAAHFFVVLGTTSTRNDITLTVNGASFTSNGVLTNSDSEIICNEPVTLNDYYETSKKWLGTVQLTISTTGAAASYSLNYGFVKYDDFANKNFTVTNFEMVGKTSASGSNFDIQLIHHKKTGWFYNAFAFSPGVIIISSLADYTANYSNISSGEYFAYKRQNLATYVNGQNDEGIIIKLVQTTNNFISYANAHIGVLF